MHGIFYFLLQKLETYRICVGSCNYVNILCKLFAQSAKKCKFESIL